MGDVSAVVVVVVVAAALAVDVVADATAALFNGDVAVLRLFIT